jgi:type IV fimbrial biogenesis protein FimT
MRRRAPQGFTIIEILIAISVLAVLIGLGVVSFGEWLQNQQIRAAGDAAQNGLQLARAEVIRRNLTVRFVLGPDTGWTVSESASGATIQARSHEEGTRNAVAATQPDGATTVTFMPLGSVTTNLDASPALSQIDFSNASGGACRSAGGPMRCLRVVVTPGGSTRMCDPAIPATVSPDARAC